ncbi:MAG TPA: DUF998 domain-containing protein [Natronosporangium sp.]
MAADRFTRWLLGAGAVGVPLFVAVFVVDGASRPGYDPAYHPVSALGLGDRGWLQIANFIVVGLLVIGFALGLRRVLRPGRASWWVPLLVAAHGVALVLSGGFVMDPMRGYPPGTPAGDPAEFSWHHQLHDAVGVVAFLAPPLACLGLAWRFVARPTRAGWLAYCLATSLAGLVLFFWFGAAWEADQASAGLVQRLAIALGWSWLPAVAIRSLRAKPDQPWP